MRLNQFIAESGLCSRRESDRLIDAGQVTVNGSLGVLGQQVCEEDIIKVSGELITPEPKRIFILVNKPLGITSTTNKADKTNIIDYVNYPKRLFTIGRLDKNSTGAILLTNDGSIVNKLLRSENEHEKTYVVQVNKPITNEFLKGMGSGVKIFNPDIDGYVITKPCKIKQLGNNKFEIILTQGYNRQIRRMCEEHGFKVITLERIKFLFLTLNGLKPGRFRKLTKEEVERLDKFCGPKSDRANSVDKE